MSRVRSQITNVGSSVENIHDTGIDSDVFRDAGITKDAFDHIGNILHGQSTIRDSAVSSRLGDSKTNSNISLLISKVKSKLKDKEDHKKLDTVIRSIEDPIKRQNLLSKCMKLNGVSLVAQLNKDYEEVESGSSTITSDKALKTDIRELGSLSNKFKALPLTTMFSHLPVKSWKYKYNDKETHIGPMAQDVHSIFGNEAAPGGKKIDVTSMIGLLSKGIGDLKKEAIIREHLLADKLSLLRKDISSYFTANLSLKGISPSGISSIF